MYAMAQAQWRLAAVAVSSESPSARQRLAAVAALSALPSAQQRSAAAEPSVPAAEAEVLDARAARHEAARLAAPDELRAAVRVVSDAGAGQRPEAAQPWAARAARP
ncbi:hypothetical protein [Bradyrhizobium sp. WD16]|uniref:hypothetical protein n=1 Tax=Bradyrhizobium sp. WD16 TaxID=1521768 RepID=UPI0035323420